MKKVLFLIIFSSVFAVVTNLSLPFDIPFESFFSARWHEMQNDWEYTKQIVKEALAEKEIPVSLPPFFVKRGENDTFDIVELTNYGNQLNDMDIQLGTEFQNLSEAYGLYDMNEALFVLREFFVNLAEILLYRGKRSVERALDKFNDELKPLQPEDMVKLQLKSKTRAWWAVLDDEKDINLYGGPKVNEEEIHYHLLNKEQVAIKKRYNEIYNFFVKLVWHSFHLYYKEYAANESLMHQNLKKEQITGHLLGNNYSLIFLTQGGSFYRVKNNYIEDVDQDEMKEKVQDFVNELETLLTKNEPEKAPKKSWLKEKIKKWWNSETLKEFHDFKKEKIRKLQSIKKEAKINTNNVFKIMALFTSNWRIFFYLHVSGTIESTKPLPEFYNHHETVEDDSNESNYSEIIERLQMLRVRSKRIISTNPVIEIGFDLEGIVEKSLDRKNPFRDIARTVFKSANLNTVQIKKVLIRILINLCTFMLSDDEECVFVLQTFRRINVYIMKDGKIAGDAFCEKTKRCKEITYSSYFLYIRKITELQATSMAILEYILLQCERTKMLKKLNREDKDKLKNDVEELFKNNVTLKIFLTEEYQKIVIDYIGGSKNSNVMKLIKMKVKKEKKKADGVEEKVYGPDINKIDDSTLDED